jgi:hypothetical protein
MASATPIPVICDRCRAEGESGTDPFEAFGALIDFEPVPRRAKRADGWDSELQRAFIALLSLTGSVKAACRALGKSEFGVTQLLRNEGGASFAAAMDEALAVSKDERSRRIAEAVRTVAADRGAWRPPEPPWSGAQTRLAPQPARRGRPPAGARHLPPPGPSTEDEDRDGKAELIEALLRKYLVKIRSERACRLEGRIVEADFFVRQLSFIEVALDLASGDAFEALKSLRVGPLALIDIAATPASLMLDRARRMQWQELGEVDRPPPPPEERFEPCRGVYVDRNPALLPTGPEAADRLRAEQAERAAAAMEQVEWEAEARREYERRRDSDAANGQEPREAGRPAPTGDRGAEPRQAGRRGERPKAARARPTSRNLLP